MGMKFYLYTTVFCPSCGKKLLLPRLDIRYHPEMIGKKETLKCSFCEYEFEEVMEIRN